MKSPCYNCEERQVGCHSTCESYKTFRAECDRLNDLKNKQKEQDYLERKRYYQAVAIKQKRQRKKYWY